MQTVFTYESYCNEDLTKSINALTKQGYVIDNICRSSALVEDGKVLHSCTVVAHKPTHCNF